MTFFRALGKALRPRSLRVQLVLPFLVVILLLTLALGWMFWWAGSRSVADLTGQLMVERTERMADAVGRHMFGAAAVLETAFPRGMRGLHDIRPAQRALATRFYTAASLHTEPSDLVYYGNENGQGYALQRLVDGNAQVRLQDGEGGARKIFMLYDIEGAPEYRFTESRLFDPRERLWYQVGKTASEHRWTGVHLDFDSGELVNSRVRQVLDGNGLQVGVVGTDIALSGLSRFIAGLESAQIAAPLLSSRTANWSPYQRAVMCAVTMTAITGGSMPMTVVSRCWSKPGSMCVTTCRTCPSAISACTPCHLPMSRGSTYWCRCTIFLMALGSTGMR